LLNYSLLLVHMVAPVLLGGVSNMVFVKMPVLDRLKRPIDAGRCARDGRRMLGDNKTWKGLVGMVGLSALWSALIDGAILQFDWPVAAAPFHPALLGALFGLAYSLAELPNSFVKRRLDIAPGKNGAGWLGRAFILVDQADSVLGCLVIALVFMPIQWVEAVAVVVLCGGLHLVVNGLLFRLKLKSQKY
jgi:hypothetical protein